MEKKLDAKGRWRNKTTSFMMSPEEREDLDTRVKLSGLTKQEYMVRRLLEREDVVTDPKTLCSNRTITMPDFLNDEVKEYIGMLYGIGENDRIFDFTKSFLHHEMERGAQAAGVKKLTLHQLRHSHVSLLINMGFTAVAIAKRVGHESIDITYRYAHMFPSEQAAMADKLNIERGAC